MDDLIQITEELALTLEQAFGVKLLMDGMIEAWDEMIQHSYPFTKDKFPRFGCKCDGEVINPIDYFIDSIGCIVLCGSCRLCGGYLEICDINTKYPLSFKAPPKAHGISTLFKKNVEEKPREDIYA